MGPDKPFCAMPLMYGVSVLAFGSNRKPSFRYEPMFVAATEVGMPPGPATFRIGEGPPAAPMAGAWSHADGNERTSDATDKHQDQHSG